MTEYIDSVWRIANCQDVAVSRSAATTKASRAIGIRGHLGEPDVIFFSEVATVNIELIAPLHDYTGLQMHYDPRSEHGDPRAGTAIAVRNKTARLMGKEELIQTSPAAEGIRARYAVSDVIKFRGTRWKRRAHAVHGSPPRAQEGFKKFVAAFRLLQGAAGGDMNARMEEMRNMITQKYVSVPGSVLGLRVPRTWKVQVIGTVDIGSDHMAIDILVRIPIRGRRHR